MEIDLSSNNERNFLISIGLRRITRSQKFYRENQDVGGLGSTRLSSADSCDLNTPHRLFVIISHALSNITWIECYNTNVWGSFNIHISNILNSQITIIQLLFKTGSIVYEYFDTPFCNFLLNISIKNI